MKLTRPWFFWIFFLLICVMGQEGFALDVPPPDDLLAPPPSLTQTMDYISPTRERFLSRRWPLITSSLPRIEASYDWKALGISIERFTLHPTVVDSDKYRVIIKKLKKELAIYSVPHREEKVFLLADLTFAISKEEDPNSLKLAYNQYQKATEEFPNSIRALSASYHMGILLILLGHDEEATYLGNRQEYRWLSKPEWASAFRVLVMESYMMRRRFIRAEDYLWELATRMNKEELTPHLARRYADSLYWQGKFSSVVQWYQNPLVSSALDDSTPAAVVSRLYFAESLFQLSRYQEALDQYSIFKEKFTKKFPKWLLEYRLLQCHLMLEKDMEKSKVDFYQLSVADGIDPRIKALADLQWARLTAKQEGDNRDITHAHVMTESLLAQVRSKDMLREVFYVKSILERRLGNKDLSFKDIVRLIPAEYSSENADGLMRAASDIGIIYLLMDAPSYWDKKDTVGFLIKADRLRFAIEITRFKNLILFWVGRAYVESGMASAGARLFQRLLFEIKPTQKNLISLELAKIYGLMGETVLMGKALDLIESVPIQPDERRLYYLTRASYDIASQRYDKCIQQFDMLLSKGVTGEDFFKYALQGSLCARKAKDFEKAEKFISFLGVDGGTISKLDPKSQLGELQLEALFETINLSVTTHRYEDAIALFEALRQKISDLKPPIEAIFSVVEAYREMHKPELAVDVWKAYSKDAQDISDDLKGQYTELLETLGQVELLPVTP